MSIQKITSIRTTTHTYEIDVKLANKDGTTLVVPIMPSSVDLRDSWWQHLTNQGVDNTDSHAIVDVLQALERANSDLYLAHNHDPRAAAFRAIIDQKNKSSTTDK